MKLVFLELSVRLAGNILAWKISSLIIFTAYFTTGKGPVDHITFHNFIFIFFFVKKHAGIDHCAKPQILESKPCSRMRGHGHFWSQTWALGINYACLRLDLRSVKGPTSTLSTSWNPEKGIPHEDPEHPCCQPPHLLWTSCVPWRAWVLLACFWGVFFLVFEEFKFWTWLSFTAGLNTVSLFYLFSH